MVLPLFPDLPEISELVESPTAEDYGAAARYALGRGRLKVAVQQVAAAMVLDPSERAYRQLFSEIVSRTPAPLKLLELPDAGVFYGLVAARAWFIASKGQATAAIRLMREVVTFRPNEPLLIWVEEWTGRPGFARKADPSAVAELIVDFLDSLTRTAPLEGAFRNLAAVATLASAVALAHSEHAGLRAARCRLLRELGDAQRALDLALTGTESWATTVEAASACRELGHRDRQIELLRQAITLAPEKSSTYLELGKVLIDSEELSQAAAVFLGAPTKGSEDFSGPAAAAYLSFLEERQRSTLVAFEQDPRPFVQRLLHDADYYDTRLPDPSDRVVEVIRDAVARGRREPGPAINVKARIDGCAAPSAELAFELGLAAIGKRGRLTLLGEHEPSHLGGLWAMRDGSPIALVDPASSDVTEVVSEFARQPFDWANWTRSAVNQTVCDLDQLLRVAVHPPTVPPEFDCVEWLVRIHTSIALLVAYHVSAWPDRSAVIERALSATDDWVCSVGVVAWFATAQRDPAHLDSAIEAFSRLQGLDPPRPYTRALAILGSISSGPLTETFRALRARIAFSPSD